MWVLFHVRIISTFEKRLTAMSDLNSTEIMNKYNLILFRAEIDEKEAKGKGDEVYSGETLAAYYIESGFNVYSAYTAPSPRNYHRAFKIAGVVTHLNPYIDVHVIYDYMDKLCREKFDAGTWEISRDRIMSNIFNVRNGVYQVLPDKRKFFWTGAYRNIGRNDKEIHGNLYRGKASLVASYRTKKRIKASLVKVEMALNTLVEFGNKTGTFLTMKDLVEQSELSEKVIRRFQPIYQPELDKYNLAEFGTDSFPQYRKKCSINLIYHTISELDTKTKPTKANVARETGLHINTVSKLWDEDAIQDALFEHFRWVKNSPV